MRRMRQPATPGPVTTAMLPISSSSDGQVRGTCWWGHQSTTAKFKSQRLSNEKASAFKARGPLTDFTGGPGKVAMVDGTGEQAEILSLNMGEGSRSAGKARTLSN